MSLMVWLPLNKEGDLQNKGLADITVTSTATYNSAGKIGGCYDATASKRISFPSQPWMQPTNNNSLSIACWVNASTFNYIIAANAFEYRLLATVAQFRLGNGGTNTINCDYNSTFTTGTWYHFVGTWNKDTREIKVYINGECKKTVISTLSAFNDINGTINLVYGGTWSLNDFRIYDHCLSPKEIKEISKGLVLHYPLNQTTESVYEGYSGVGSNWDGTVVTTDLPTGAAYALQGYVWMKYNLPINRYDTYELKVTYKGNSSPSGTYSYFSLKPYDIDGKFISHTNCLDGFSNSTYWTTLTQDLKPGDTVLHCADLSNWTTANNNHYYFVAIMGYKDSTGYEYSDYTQDTPQFGSYADKSNLNKTDNTITLKSAYTGVARKAGTQIRQATAGSSYYYPFYFKQADVTAWTDKTVTIIPNNSNRLKYAASINMGAIYNGLYTKISWKNTSNPEKIYDCSGYGNNGISPIGLSSNTDTPRYDKSTIFDENQYIVTPIGTGIPSNNLTVACWVKRPEVIDSYTMRRFLAPSTNGNNQQFYFRILPSSDLSTATFNVGFGVNTHGTGRVDANWHHLAATTGDDGKTIKTYIDGRLITTSSESNAFTIAGDFYIAATFKGTLSDLRFYRTTLSDDDILELYNTSVLIDNQGNDYCYEFKEDSANIFTPETLKVTAKDSSLLYWQDYADEKAIPMNAAHFYYGSGDLRNNLHLGSYFKANTRYKFDMWINYDNILYNGENKPGGLTINYTDGTYSNALVDTGDGTNKKGYIHKVFISPAGKTIKGLSVYYWTKTPAYYRWDSTITPYYENTKFNKTGIINSDRLSEGLLNVNNFISELYPGLIKTNNLIEI